MFIDAYHDRDQDLILIVGRDKNDKRFYNTLKPDYSFYYLDYQHGKFTSVFGEPLTKVTANTFKSFQKEQKILSGRKLYESDVKPIFKALEQNFLNADLPNLHTAPVDIETGFDEVRGFAPPDDPHQPITAITLNYDWTGQLITLALRPPTVTGEDADAIATRFDNCYIFDDEAELLKTFYELIEDVDILYTWNGDTFDIPYIVNRTTKVLGKDYTRKMCLWNMLPKKRTFEKFGKEQFTYDLTGRIHLDYLELYKKYTYHEQPSYRLDFIGEVELGERKVHYEGTLDQLYKQDFQKFIEYNRQDVALLKKLEAKLKFIGLTNVLAHENCVLFGTTMGAVALTDQAVILEAHRRNMIVPARDTSRPSYKIAGAYVAKPKSGLHDWVASVDINSLYPSTIRTLNMSPETLVGQIRQDLTEQRLKQNRNQMLDVGEQDDEDDDEEADKWEGLFACLEYDEVMKKSNVRLTVDLENEQDPLELTAAELYQWIFESDSNLCLSANGTIFRTDIDGVIPSLLERWYADRKEMQKEMKKYDKLVKEHYDDPEKRKEYELLRDYWDQRQMARKINLNAAYGAITNAGSRFCDPRIGQSTTLSGRTILKHMMSRIGELLYGEYSIDTPVNVYGDTDSNYFTVAPILDSLKDSGFEFNKDSFVELANGIADGANDSFPEFVTKAFNVVESRKNLIKCGRELCMSKGLFLKKKHYAVLYYDKDNVRWDYGNTPDGKLYIKGLATQRADTPESIQKFLKEVLSQVLTGSSEKDVINFIREFRGKVKSLQPWEKGTPKKVNNLTKYGDMLAANSKAALPGHVRASINWNALRKMHGDNTVLPITDGQKTIVCKLKKNPLGYTSIAYPIDEFMLPKWFKELPFDVDTMEETLIDLKLERIIGILNWNLELSKLSKSFSNLFEIEEE